MRWTVGRKLALGFALVLFLLGGVSAYTYVQLDNVDDDYTALLEQQVDKILLIEEMVTNVNAQRVNVYSYLLLGDEQIIEAYNELSNEYSQLESQLEPQIHSQEGLQALAELKTSYRAYQQVITQVVQKKNNNQDYMTLLSTDGARLGNQFKQDINDLREIQKNILVNENDRTSSKAASTKSTMIIIVLIIIITGVVIAFYISRHISKPLQMLRERVLQIADGDLSGEALIVKNKDEIGELTAAIRQMKENLRELVVNIQAGAAQVSASSEELAATSNEVSDATNHVAIRIQEMASGAETIAHIGEESAHGMEEAAGGVQKIAESTALVAEASHAVNEEANRGQAEIQHAVEQMESISTAVRSSAQLVDQLGARANEIGQIVAVISEITAQTNLLALNAAIEAARAGESGRGFAVVADEVRKLAEESKHSADQIAQLIQATQEDTKRAITGMETGVVEVEQGEAVIRNAGESFKSIVQSIQHVVGQIEEVSAASEEVSAATEEVTASVHEMANGALGAREQTQEVAGATEEELASMEEIAQSAKSLSELAEELQSMVAQFKV